MLDLRVPAGGRIAVVGLARQGGGVRRAATASGRRDAPAECGGKRSGRRPAAWWRASSRPRGRHVRVCAIVERIDLASRQVGARSRPASRPTVVVGLAHHRRAHHHAQRVERHLGAIAVGVHHQPGLEHAVVVAGFGRIDVPSAALADGDAVAQRVAGLDHQQVVGIVGDEALGADRVGVERVAIAVRQEEVLAGVGEFLRGGVVAARRIEDAPGGNPPVGVAFAVDVSAFVRPGRRSTSPPSVCRCRRRSAWPAPA